MSHVIRMLLIGLIFTCGMFSNLWASNPAMSNGEDDLTNAFPSVYLLAMPQWGGGVGVCSGVAVLEGRVILTANHCVPSTHTMLTNDLSTCEDGIYFDSTADNYFPNLDCPWQEGVIDRIVRHPSRDLTALVLHEPVADYLEMDLAFQEPEAGPLTWVGYGLPNLGVRQFGVVEKVKRTSGEDYSGTWANEYMIHTNPGDSGGAAIIDGKLVGLTSWGLTDLGKINDYNDSTYISYFQRLSAAESWIQDLAASLYVEGEIEPAPTPQPAGAGAVYAIGHEVEGKVVRLTGCQAVGIKEGMVLAALGCDFANYDPTKSPKFYVYSSCPQGFAENEPLEGGSCTWRYLMPDVDYLVTSKTRTGFQLLVMLRPLPYFAELTLGDSLPAGTEVSTTGFEFADGQVSMKTSLQVALPAELLLSGTMQINEWQSEPNPAYTNLMDGEFAFNDEKLLGIIEQFRQTPTFGKDTDVTQIIPLALEEPMIDAVLAADWTAIIAAEESEPTMVGEENNAWCAVGAGNATEPFWGVFLLSFLAFIAIARRKKAA